MKLLLISDTECKALWDYFQPERLSGISAIVSCGDLKREYLEFLVTLGKLPLFYVPGNHDERYTDDPPGGCDCLDDTLTVFEGVRMIGFGGCKWYGGGTYQYTEKEMRKRVRKAHRAIKKAGGVDLVVTHAAMQGYGDAPDAAHQGFECFRELVDEWKPKYFVHGHMHGTYGDIPRRIRYRDTEVVNAFERYVIEI